MVIPTAHDPGDVLYADCYNMDVSLLVSLGGSAVKRGTILVASVVTLLVAGLLAYHANWIRQRHAALESLNDYRSGDEMTSTGIGFEHENRPPLPWILKILGEYPREIIIVTTRSGPEEFAPRKAMIQPLFPEAQIIEWPRWDYRDTVLPTELRSNSVQPYLDTLAWSASESRAPAGDGAIPSSELRPSRR